jgi:hypothetical protein
MMPFAKNEKNRQGSRQTFWRIRTRCPQPHGGQDTYEARADYRRNLAGTMRAQGNHGLKSPRRLGAANGLPVRW